MKTVTKLILTALIVVLIQIPVFSASDYLDEISVVKYWDQPRNITVWVQEHKYQDIAYSAFNAWMRASGGCVRFVDAPSEYNANINVYFVKTSNLDGENAIGQTYYYRNSPTIKIATQGFSRLEIETTLLHEIGHALGIQGHTQDRRSIMYPNTNSAAGRRITNKDEATIRRMYCGR